MKVLVQVAMDSEYAEVLKLLGGKPEGEIAGNEIILGRSGIGKVNAAVRAVELINLHHPACLVSTGVAGGIDPLFHSMDLVVARRVVYHDVWCGRGCEYGRVQGLPLYYEADETLYNCAMSLGGKAAVHGGLVCSGDMFIDDDKESGKIKERFPDGIAVDMESAALAQVCRIYGVPFLSLRMISDVAGNHHMDDYENFWETLSEKSFGVIKDFLERLPDKL